MPTTRLRHMITESDEIAAFLRLAEATWPELKEERAELLRKLIAEGASQLQAKAEETKARRQKFIQESAGRMDDVWPDNWREELRADWPE